MTPEDWTWIDQVIQDLKVGSSARDAAVILLSALAVGANGDKIARATGLNRDKVVRPIAKRLRDNGVWHNGVTHCSWFDANSEIGAIAFGCDLRVAEGTLLREPSGDDVKYLRQDGTTHTRPGQEDEEVRPLG